MFEKLTATRPVAPTSVREAGYYWLGAGIVAAFLVGLFLVSRIGATTDALVTVASTFYEFAVFGAITLSKQREG